MAIEGAARLGRDVGFQQQAANTIAGVDLAGSIHLASALFEAFGVEGIPIARLSRAQVSSILSQLVPIDRFDNKEHDLFFSCVGEYAPDLLFDFFFERLKRYGEVRTGRRVGYAHWGNTHPRTYFAKAQPPVGVLDQLQKVRDFLAEGTLPAIWTAELFWVFGDAGGAAQAALNEWLTSGDQTKIRLARSLAEDRTSGEDSKDAGAGFCAPGMDD
jgi:hypothetical protein